MKPRQKKETETEADLRLEEGRPAALVSLKQIQEDVALQRKYLKTQMRLAAMRTWITAFMLLTLGALLVVGVPKVYASLARVDAMMDELEGLDINALTKTLEGLDLSALTKSVEVLERQGNSLDTVTGEKLDGVLKQLSDFMGLVTQIDVGALTKSIEEFSALMEPLMELVR